MKGKRSVVMMVMALALLMAGNTVFAAAQGANAKLLIGNGTGGEITALVISPAKEKYPKNENRLAFQNLKVEDKTSFAVVLSEQFKGVDTFDIEIVSNGKRYVTQKGVKIDLKNGELPTLELSRRGKDSTLALAGATTGAVGTAVALTGTATAMYTGVIMFGQVVGVAALTEGLGMAGAIIGGGMLSGIGVVIAAPVVLGVGGYLIGRALTPGGLEVQVYYN